MMNKPVARRTLPLLIALLAAGAVAILFLGCLMALVYGHNKPQRFFESFQDAQTNADYQVYQIKTNDKQIVAFVQDSQLASWLTKNSEIEIQSISAAAIWDAHGRTDSFIIVYTKK